MDFAIMDICPDTMKFMKCKQLKHDMSDEKPRGGWMEFEYVMDLAPGTQNNYFKIDS